MFKIFAITLAATLLPLPEGEDSNPATSRSGPKTRCCPLYCVLNWEPYIPCRTFKKHHLLLCLVFYFCCSHHISDRSCCFSWILERKGWRAEPHPAHVNLNKIFVLLCFKLPGLLWPSVTVARPPESGLMQRVSETFSCFAMINLQLMSIFYTSKTVAF